MRSIATRLWLTIISFPDIRWFVYGREAGAKEAMEYALEIVLAFMLFAAGSGQSQECVHCCKEAIPLIVNSIPINVTANPLLEHDVEVDRDEIVLSENNTNDAWCSVLLPETNRFVPYVEFQFNSKYVIERVIIAGPSNMMGSVTAFLIQNNTDQYSMSSNTNEGRVMVYSREYNTSSLSFDDTPVNITLDDPVLAANSIRIIPNTWTENPPCMRLELYGCIYNESTGRMDDGGGGGKGGGCDNMSLELYILRSLMGLLSGGILILSAVAFAVICKMYCCRLKEKEIYKEIDQTNYRSASIDSNATIRNVNNSLYQKSSRASDKRPLTPSSTSTMTYETVPVSTLSSEQLQSRSDRTTKENHNETDGRNLSHIPIPIFEVQYEHVNTKDGHGAEKGSAESSEELTEESKNDTICSHHSYAVIRDKCSTILEASSEGSTLARSQQDQLDISEQQLHPGSTDVGMREGGPIRKRPRGSSYENVFTPDSRNAIFSESSGPQHFAV